MKKKNISFICFLIAAVCFYISAIMGIINKENWISDFLLGCSFLCLAFTPLTKDKDDKKQ